MSATVKVLRVDLPRRTYAEVCARAEIAARADGRDPSMGEVVAEALRLVLPALRAMSDPPMAQGSQPQISIDTGLQIGLSALSRIAEHTPPPRRFSHPVQLAIPFDLWTIVERERARLGMSFDELVVWACARTPARRASTALE
jgi:hypothetical protein